MRAADATMQFFGLVGVLTCVALAPVVAAAQWLGWIDLAAVPPYALGLALLNGACAQAGEGVSGGGEPGGGGARL